MLGWILIVSGVLLALLGLAAILGSNGPGVDDPNGARITGVVVIVIGLAISGGGVWVVRRTPKPPRESLDPAAQFANALRRQVRGTLIGTAVTGTLLMLIGIASLIYSLAQDDAVRSFKSATLCQPGVSSSDCYEQRPISITGVDVSQGRSGETDTVRFLDAGTPQKVSLHPGNGDSSVLRTGATGTATLWQGRYTNLDVAGVSFATDENPVGQQSLSRFVAVLGIGSGLLLAAGFWYTRSGRKRGVAIASADGLPQAQQDTMPTELIASYPGLPYVIRPKPIAQRVKPWTWLFALGFLLFTYLELAKYGAGAQLVMVGVEVVLLVGFVTVQLLTSRNTTLFVDELGFGSTDAFGRRTTFPRGDAARLVSRIVWNPKNRTTSSYPIAFVIGGDGSSRLRITPRLYEPGAMAGFAAALRVPYEDDPLPITPAELNKEIPSSMSWIVRHSTASGAVLAVVLFGVVMAAVVLTAGANHR